LKLAARIERLYTAERWRVGTIARHLHVHRDTVRRVLRGRLAIAPGVPLRQSLIDAYRPFVRETLEKYPTLAASRLYDMELLRDQLWIAYGPQIQRAWRAQLVREYPPPALDPESPF
jgi:AraC-like DNA-binding protein